MSDDKPARPAEPEWITKLAAAGVNAARDRQYRDRRLGTHGAANEGPCLRGAARADGEAVLASCSSSAGRRRLRARLAAARMV